MTTKAEELPRLAMGGDRQCQCSREFIIGTLECLIAEERARLALEERVAKLEEGGKPPETEGVENARKEAGLADLDAAFAECDKVADGMKEMVAERQTIDLAAVVERLERIVNQGPYSMQLCLEQYIDELKAGGK